MLSIFCSSDGKMACIRGSTFAEATEVEGGDRFGDWFSKADLSVSASPECTKSGELILNKNLKCQ